MRALLLIAALAATCNPTPPAPAPQPAQDAGPCATTCCAACSVLARYDCPEGRPTAHGVTCEEMCLAVEGTGTVLLPVDCVASARTFADVAGCGVRCSR